MTGPIVIVNVRAGLVSTPPFPVPPSSAAVTVTVATPSVSAAGVYVSVPSGATAGWTLNSAALLALTENDTPCDDSFAGPCERSVAQPETACGPASSSAV